MPDNQLVLYKIEKSTLMKRRDSKSFYYYIPWINKYVAQNMLRRELSLLGKTVAEYYDRWFLDITSVAERPKCKECDSPLTIKVLNRGYGSFCGNRCSTLHKNRIDTQSGNHAFQNLETHEKGRLTQERLGLGFYDLNVRSKGQKKSLEIQKKFRLGFYNPMNWRGYSFGYSGHYKSSKSGEVYYRSLLELSCYLRLDNDPSVINYIPEPGFYNYFNEHDGREHEYWPDLRVNYKDGTYKIIEIKFEHHVDDYVTQIKSKACVEVEGSRFEFWTDKKFPEQYKEAKKYHFGK
jgi:hypothetical protein